MTTMTRPWPTRLLALVAAAVLGLVGLASTAAPASADTGGPQLSISVDDGQDETSSSATLHYRVTVSNLGGTTLRNLTVSQTLAPATKVVSVDDGGSTAKGEVRWAVDLAAGRSATLRTTVQVGKDLPPDLLRLATVACARTSPTAAPTVCGSDSDQLPAGAAAAQQERRLDAARSEHRTAWLLPTGLVAGGLLLVGGVLAVTVLRRRAGSAAGRRPLVPHEPA